MENSRPSNSGKIEHESLPVRKASSRNLKSKKEADEPDIKLHTTRRNDSRDTHAAQRAPVKFSYWKFKGIAEPIRWLLGYMKAEFEEWNPSSNDEWFKEKKIEYKGHFPNLPNIENGDYILSQSSAIPIYLCNYFGKPQLLGKTYLDEARVKEIECVIIDIREAYYKAIWSDSPEEKIRSLLKAENPNIKRLEYLSKCLDNRDYFLGYLTWADLQFAYLCEFLDCLTVSFGENCPSCVHKNLSELAGRVRELDGIKQRVAVSGDVQYFPPEFLTFKFMTFNEMVKAYQAMGTAAN